MEKNGQMQIEAIVCIAIIFATIAFSIETIGLLKKANEKNLEMLFSETEAQKCSAIADTIFSNSGGKTDFSANCTVGNKNTVESSKGGKTKSAFSVSEGIGSNQIGEKTVLEVRVDAHYR